MTTFIHKYKCRFCDLHFSTFSWLNDKPNPHCPECGQTESFIHWIEETEAQIFQFIPGKAKLIEVEGELIDLEAAKQAVESGELP